VLRSDRLRRVLLGAVTALIVARPLVAGEDAGRLHSSESVSGIWLNMLWITAALVGALWLGRSHRPLRLGGWVPAGLHFSTASIIFVTLAVSCYRHPGWMMTWEWAVLGIVFLLVRAVASDTDAADDSGGAILGAVMASAVSVAVYGIYQTIAAKSGLPVPELGVDLTPVLPPDADFLGQAESARELPDLVCRSVFQRPDTLLAFCLLALPLLIAFARSSIGWRAKWAGTLIFVLAGAIVLSAIDYAQGASRLLPSIGTAWRMFAGNPLFGVGPGNFDRWSPRLQSPELPSVLGDGGDALMEVLATGGLLLAVPIIATFALILVQIRRWAAEETPTPIEPFAASGPRWEFYLGGVAGLLVGLILRLADHPAAAPANSILQVGVGAVIRAIVWFISFALFEGSDWRSPLRRRCIGIGIGLVVLLGLVSPAILRPAILQPTIVLAALALGPSVVELLAAPPKWRWAPVPVMFVFAVMYLFLVNQPIYQSASGVTEARRAGRAYSMRRAKVIATEEPIMRQAETVKLNDFVDRAILGPLHEAWASDSYDVGPELEWCGWYIAYWKVHPEVPHDRALGMNGLNGEVDSKRAPIGIAAEHDPQGTAPLVAELQLRLLYSQFTRAQIRERPKMSEAELKNFIDEWRATHLRAAEALIPRIVERDPALEARVRFRLAQTLIQSGDASRLEAGRQTAAAVWELEQKAPGPRWRLPREQRTILRRWLSLPAEHGERIWLTMPILPSRSWTLVPYDIP
jgi:hypothetical protein